MSAAASIAAAVDAATIPHSMGVVDLINSILVPAFGLLDWPAWFTDRAITASTPSQLKKTPLDGRVVMIKYLDYNKDWAKWARECRGIIVMLQQVEEGDGGGDKKAGRLWVPIRYALQRGAEMLTGLHLQHGIAATQDTAEPSNLPEAPVSRLGPSQQQLVRTFVAGGPLAPGTTLSMKSDGSLLCATWYRGAIGDDVAKMVAQYGDDFSRTALPHFAASGMMILLASQGTMFMPDQVQDYTSHAALAAIGMPESAIAALASNCTPAQALALHGAPFYAKLQQMFRAYPIHPQQQQQDAAAVTSITLNFESVVRNRTTAWGAVHVELAIDYPRSAVTFLGGGVCHSSGLVYADPHFHLLPHGVNVAPVLLPEPYWWPAGHTAEVEAMMEGLDSIIHGTMAPRDFIARFPPAGTSSSTSQTQGQETLVPQLDYEGFVLYSPEPSANGASGDIVFEYNKIKTSSYYIAHKFKYRNLDQLIKLAPTAGHIFPLIRIVHDFFASLADRLVASISTVHAELAKGSSSVFFSAIAANPKAALSFERQPADVKLKMLANVSGQLFTDFCFDAFVAHFRELGGIGLDRKEVTGLLKSMAMKYCMVQTLRTDWIKQDAANLRQDELLKQLFALCLKSGSAGDGDGN